MIGGRCAFCDAQLDEGDGIFVLTEIAPTLDRPSVVILCSAACVTRSGAAIIRQTHRVHRRGRGRKLTPVEAAELCRDL